MTDQVLTLASNTNVGVIGRWAFQTGEINYPLGCYIGGRNVTVACSCQLVKRIVINIKQVWSSCEQFIYWGIRRTFVYLQTSRSFFWSVITSYCTSMTFEFGDKMRLLKERWNKIRGQDCMQRPDFYSVGQQQLIIVKGALYSDSLSISRFSSWLATERKLSHFHNNNDSQNVHWFIRSRIYIWRFCFIVTFVMLCALSISRNFLKSNSLEKRPFWFCYGQYSTIWWLVFGKSRLTLLLHNTMSIMHFSESYLLWGWTTPKQTTFAWRVQ